MPALNLSFDEVLTTTRSVRKRLDLTRPVEPEVIRECLELAVQAPTPGDRQNWHFLVVTDPAQRQALAELYRKGAVGMDEHVEQRIAEDPHFVKSGESALYLIEHLHEVPVHVIPCIEGRSENLSTPYQASTWGAILPATWSFMLAARSRGLGTVLTSVHLLYEREAADILGIPYDEVMQVGLIPLAYTVGTSFKPATRKPLETVLHWERW
ncbi:nitroreductase [Ktedonosporobacter rubrisoli]|uniref:Nitroreductase n=1 Tax=Ktedonosporobacter rubrisoli TaxID=2509675 RepID=A0A4V0YZT4_KTERU|nr:nitroreductase family protein [Ktedonosporobacter rubrisoli]QBD80831.1 nitroreductase [Ktedonosporobacter rubrisoli]